MRHVDIERPYGGRTESLARLIPDLFDHRTFLYIGAHANRLDLGEQIPRNSVPVTAPVKAGASLILLAATAAVFGGS